VQFPPEVVAEVRHQAAQGATARTCVFTAVHTELARFSHLMLGLAWSDNP